MKKRSETTSYADNSYLFGDLEPVQVMFNELKPNKKKTYTLLLFNVTNPIQSPYNREKFKYICYKGINLNPNEHYVYYDLGEDVIQHFPEKTWKRAIQRRRITFKKEELYDIIITFTRPTRKLLYITKHTLLLRGDYDINILLEEYGIK